MPRFFFHIRTGGGQLLKDTEGQEFASLQEVENDAMASAKEILAEGLLAGKPVFTGDAFEIFDQSNVLVLEFPFSRAAEKPGARP
ncbi:hypothetical protein NKI94_31120 [Mesorhizobium australicum]|uniref:DUF6894 family protein n=1 Tax=Mesorhizobium australicum TaxID=536018 RepID=UPI0003CE6A47|nr:hypothetical protein X739_33535 [Mesorhizobium sp. LNHC220B00]